MPAKTHGHTSNGRYTPTYQSWKAMWRRCTNPNHKAYHHYGGRGIRICTRWKSFESFLGDMGERPKGLMLDRKNNDGDYTPGNCRWVTQKVQNQNSRAARQVIIGGRTQCVTAWAEETGIGQMTLSLRVRMGWLEHQLLRKPNPSRHLSAHESEKE